MRKVRATTHREVLHRMVKRPGFRKGYEEELDRLRLVEALIALRQRQGLTQRAVARRLGVSQPFVAKLERAEAHNFTLDSLIKLVRALNGKLRIEIKPAKSPARSERA